MDDIFIWVIIAPFGFGGGNPPAILEVVAGIVDPLALTLTVPELITGFVLPPLTLLVGILSEFIEFRAETNPVVSPQSVTGQPDQPDRKSVV